MFYLHLYHSYITQTADSSIPRHEMCICLHLLFTINTDTVYSGLFISHNTQIQYDLWTVDPSQSGHLNTRVNIWAFLRLHKTLQNSLTYTHTFLKTKLHRKPEKMALQVLFKGLSNNSWLLSYYLQPFLTGKHPVLDRALKWSSLQLFSMLSALRRHLSTGVCCRAPQSLRL